jgi:elongation factor P
MIGVGDLKRGITIELDGTLYSVLEYHHIKMGRGSAQVRLKLRDVRGGHTLERSFQATEKFARARVERFPAQYLYRDGDIYHFMNTGTFDQVPVREEVIGDSVYYMKENETYELSVYQDQPIGVELPVAVELAITETEPGFKGDTASGGGKPAKTETGLTVQVPFFVNEGDVVKVDTRSGEYLERVSS